MYINIGNTKTLLTVTPFLCIPLPRLAALSGPKLSSSAAWLQNLQINVRTNCFLVRKRCEEVQRLMQDKEAKSANSWQLEDLRGKTATWRLGA